MLVSQGTRLKILILGLHFSPEPTGIAPYTSGLAFGLAERGHHVRVRTGYPHYPYWKYAEGYSGSHTVETMNGIEVERFRPHLADPTNMADRVRMEVDFGLRSCRRSFGDPDVILTVTPTLLASALAISRARVTRGRPPVAVWVQDLYGAGVAETGVGNKRSARAVAKLESRVLRSADGVIAIHRRMGDHIVGKLGVDPSRLHLIRNWTHITSPRILTKQDARKLLGWNPNETIVLHAGNMGIKQDLINVVEAARRSTDNSVRFALLGDGSQRESLEEAAAGLDNVSFIQPLPDDKFSAALTAADILLVNEHQGMSEMSVPSKLTSYFAASRPVIAATEPLGVTAAELLDSGSGVLVPPRSPDELNAAIAAIAADPARAAELGRAGEHFHKTTLGSDHAISAFETALTSIRERPR